MKCAKWGAKMNRGSNSSPLLQTLLSYAVPSISYPDLSPFGGKSLLHYSRVMTRVAMRKSDPGEY